MKDIYILELYVYIVYLTIPILYDSSLLFFPPSNSGTPCTGDTRRHPPGTDTGNEGNGPYMELFMYRRTGSRKCKGEDKEILASSLQVGRVRTIHGRNRGRFYWLNPLMIRDVSFPEMGDGKMAECPLAGHSAGALEFRCTRNHEVDRTGWLESIPRKLPMCRRTDHIDETV